MPASDYTRCPKLDTTIKSRLPKQCKDADQSLARIQALVLDPVGPLTHFWANSQMKTDWWLCP